MPPLNLLFYYITQWHNWQEKFLRGELMSSMKYEQYKQVIQSLVNYVSRVSKGKEYASEKEVEVLPEIVKILLNDYYTKCGF